MLMELCERMDARIIMAMTGTSSQREREDSDARNPSYLRNRFNGSMMREITILHSLDQNLLLAFVKNKNLLLPAPRAERSGRRAAPSLARPPNKLRPTPSILTHQCLCLRQSQPHSWEPVSSSGCCTAGRATNRVHSSSELRRRRPCCQRQTVAHPSTTANATVETMVVAMDHPVLPPPQRPQLRFCSLASYRVRRALAAVACCARLPKPPLGLWSGV
jgi:hypothetical protein